MSRLHLLRVFCAEDGSGGNPLGVFLHGAAVPPERRQAVAADLGLSETVFVDDAGSGTIRIFTPAEELDFAGHPSVGTAWLLGDVHALRPPAGEVPVRRDAERRSRDGATRVGAAVAAGGARLAQEVEALDGHPEDPASSSRGHGSTRTGGRSAPARSAGRSASPRTRPPAPPPQSSVPGRAARSRSGRAEDPASGRAPRRGRTRRDRRPLRPGRGARLRLA